MAILKSTWKITSNHIDGRTIYGVYRAIDPSEVDHSGNREFYGDYMESREEAIAIVEKLNSAD